MWDRLTDNEVQTFMRIIEQKLPVLEIGVASEKKFLMYQREMPMTDELIATIECRTEKNCRVFNIIDTWKGILEKGIPDHLMEDENTCNYIREINRLFGKGLL